MDKILLIFSLFLVAVIIGTGFFGLLGGSFGFNWFSSGPSAAGPGGGGLLNFFRNSYLAPVSDSYISSPQRSGVNGSAPTVSASSIEIATVAAYSASARDEYVMLRHTGNAPVNLTSWSLGNTLGHRFQLGPAAILAKLGDEEALIVKPGQTVYVHTGSSPLNQSFQENACIGYLNTSDFSSTISSSCPRFTKFSPQRFTDRCIRFLERSASSCRPPTVTADDLGMPSDCVDYAFEHFTYKGCVNDFRTASDFYTGIWHVYLKRPERLWRSDHDIITLYDASGRAIDTYQY